VVYEDEVAIAFLDAYPSVYGHALVAPRAHLEQVTGDFAQEQYLGLQKAIYCVAEAVRLEVSAERVYLLSFGSNQGNAHVHWHIAPLPPGIPYKEQQLVALQKGILAIPEEDQALLAARLRRRLAESRGG